MYVAIVEDDPDLARQFAMHLELDGISGVVYDRDFEHLLQPEHWQGVTTAVVDYMLGCDVTGVDILRYLVAEHPHIWRVLMTATEEVNGLANARLPKPFYLRDLKRVLR